MPKRSSSQSGHWCEIVNCQSSERCGKGLHANWICPRIFTCIICKDSNEFNLI